MYLFYVMKGNYIPMGSDGAIKVPGPYQHSRKKIIELANNFLGGRAGAIYLMPRWTQEMCEMTPFNFTVYVMRNGEKIACS